MTYTISLTYKDDYLPVNRRIVGARAAFDFRVTESDGAADD